MKSLRRLFWAALLASALAAATFADDGIIHGDSPQPAPTPSPEATATDPQQAGATVGDPAAPVSADALVEAALRVIGQVLAIY